MFLVDFVIFFPNLARISLLESGIKGHARVTFSQSEDRILVALVMLG